MPTEELVSFIFEIVVDGIEVGTPVKFPVDAAGAASSTSLACQGTTSLVELGNGITTEVAQVATVEAGATTATTAGVGLLGMEVGAVGAAIAPALGVLAGVGLYNLAPEFWTNVSDKLIKAGQTVGGKVRTFLNGDNKQFGVSDTTIEIFKKAFMDAGLYNSTVSFPEFNSSYTINANGTNYTISKLNLERMTSSYINGIPPYLNRPFDYAIIGTSESSGVRAENVFTFNNEYVGYYLFETPVPPSTDSKNQTTIYSHYADIGQSVSSQKFYNCIYEGNNAYITVQYVYFNSGLGNSAVTACLAYLLRVLNYPNAQPDATYPTEQPFPETYPTWKPWSVPEGLPTIYPIEIPQINPLPNQGQAQNPNPDPDPDALLDALLELLPMPQPILDPSPSPSPEPVPEVDPDPQPEPSPLPDPAPAPVPELDPPNPNPTPKPSPLPIPVPIPATVESNKLFTVYNPSVSQLNELGGFLWSSNIIDQLLKMWQNPLDGIISLQKVYASPTTGEQKKIVLGYLDTGVLAPIVTQQFQTIDCGSVSIAELKRNATDYTPYVDLHLYLPFIGFVELDPDEFMNGSINIVYKVDMYTGTCIAEVKCIRSTDMPNPTTLYQFSGNASQQIPLTSGNANGLISSLVSVVGSGISIASGGAVGAAGAINSIGHSLTHEMLHVGHSSSLSANAGIMGSRYPAIIIGRRHGYDANGYNELYGYPANKTIYLGNTKGFTRVKAGRLRTKATQNEKDEIMELLRKGVII